MAFVRTHWFCFYFFIFIKKSFFFFGATPMAYGNFQARGQIRATAAGLGHTIAMQDATISATYTTAHGNIGSLTH